MTNYNPYSYKLYFVKKRSIYHDVPGIYAVASSNYTAASYTYYVGETLGQ